MAVCRMLLVTKTHHERDETKFPDRLSLQDIGQVEINIIINPYLFSLYGTVCKCGMCCHSLSARPSVTL